MVDLLEILKKIDWRKEIFEVLNVLPTILIFGYIAYAYQHDVMAYKTAYEECFKSVYGSYIPDARFNKSFSMNLTKIWPSNVSDHDDARIQPLTTTSLGRTNPKT